MNQNELEKLTKEQLIDLLLSTEAKFADSNAYSAELVIQAEEAENFLKGTIDNLPLIFFAKNEDRKIILANKLFRECFAPDAIEIVGQYVEDVLPKHIHEIFLPLHKSALRNKKIAQKELKFAFEEGNTRTFHAVHFPYVDESGGAYAVGCLMVDISEQKALQEQNYHTSKLVALGHLSAGIGHEINNPLAICLGNLTLLEKTLNEKSVLDSKTQHYLQRMSLACHRISNIIKGMRSFAREDGENPIPISFNAIIRETVEMLTDIYLKEGVKLEFKLPEGECAFLGRTGRLQQVLMNLISNAKDATEERTDRRITVSLVKLKKTALLSVKDNGCGIPDNIKDKIFNHFFTTKPIGKGTGLGLGIVDTIVKEHSGKLSFVTSLKSGTEFTVEIPLCNETLKESNESKTSERALIANKLKVLVVDDEEGVREVLKSYLISSGCEVTEASNGVEALDILQKEIFDFAFIDVMMPRLDGISVIKQIHAKKIHPLPQFVVITGGVAPEALTQQQALAPGMVKSYLYKPFELSTIEELLKSQTSELKKAS